LQQRRELAGGAVVQEERAWIDVCPDQRDGLAAVVGAGHELHVFARILLHQINQRLDARRMSVEYRNSRSTVGEFDSDDRILRQSLRNRRRFDVWIAPRECHLPCARIEPAHSKPAWLALAGKPHRLVIGTECDRPVAIGAGLSQQLPFAAIRLPHVDQAIAIKIIAHRKTHMAVMVGKIIGFAHRGSRDSDHASIGDVDPIHLTQCARRARCIWIRYSHEYLALLSLDASEKISRARPTTTTAIGFDAKQTVEGQRGIPPALMDRQSINDAVR